MVAWLFCWGKAGNRERNAPKVMEEMSKSDNAIRPPHYEEDENYLLDRVVVLWRHKWLILSLLILSSVGTAIYLYFKMDIYQAKATIIPLKGKGQINIPFFQGNTELDIIKSLLTANLPVTFQDPTTTTIMAVLHSRSFNLVMVEKNNLLPKLFEQYWDKKQKKWIGDGQRRLYENKTFTERVFGQRHDFQKYCPTPIDGANLLIDKLSFSRSEPENNWLELRFEDEDPVFAASILGRYLTELDQYLRNQEIERATANQKYLQKLIKTQQNTEIRKGLNNVMVAQIEAAMYASGISDFLFKVVDPPLVPQEPKKPRRLRMLLLSLIATLFVAIYFAFFVEYVRKAKERWKTKTK